MACEFCHTISGSEVQLTKLSLGAFLFPRMARPKPSMDVTRMPGPMLNPALKLLTELGAVRYLPPFWPSCHRSVNSGHVRRVERQPLSR